MFVRFFNRCWLAVAVFLFATRPLWAAEAAAELETQEWVVSYSIMILFLGLILLVLLRRTNRNDSAFSFDEQQAQKEEDMKKLRGSH